ncbi:hypothetical protein THIOM_000654 [Candidatus Thiomargarita nelsonii]|uniref:Uncharacterized protein n=1 Tax=Candidatus Thiomargarita nelsonii TaxID=1003181 RepID=A0A176S6G3_9GAMM|nr:hypothetical protein THIOM_000654 [Candidatus Thiomargarita nelsonii]
MDSGTKHLITHNFQDRRHSFTKHFRLIHLLCMCRHHAKLSRCNRLCYIRQMIIPR